MKTSYEAIQEILPTFFIPTHMLGTESTEIALTTLLTDMNAAPDPLVPIKAFMVNWPTRKVVCAANVYYHEHFPDGRLLITGARHSDPIMNNMLRTLKLFDGDFKDAIAQARFEGKTEQGFIDQWGNFMNRRQALLVALAADQPINWKRNGSTDILFSEGLY